MIIKLTNATKSFEDEALLINSRHILSVFEVQESEEVEGVKEFRSVTSIYTITKESWAVKESVNEVYKLIKGGVAL